MDIIEFHNAWHRFDNNIKKQLVLSQRHFEKPYDPKILPTEYNNTYVSIININHLILKQYLLCNLNENNFDAICKKEFNSHLYWSHRTDNYFDYFKFINSDVNLNQIEEMFFSNLDLKDKKGIKSRLDYIDFDYDNFFSEKNLRVIYRILNLENLILRNILFDSRLPIIFLRKIKNLIIVNPSVYYPNRGENLSSTDGILKYLLNEDIESIILVSAGLNHLSKLFIDVNIKGNYGRFSLLKLKILCLQWNPIRSEDLEELSNAPNLEYLNLSRTNIKTLEYLPYLPNLKLIDISWNCRLFPDPESGRMTSNNWMPLEILKKYKNIIVIANDFNFQDDDFYFHNEEDNDIIRDEDGEIISGINAIKYIVNKNNITLVSNKLPYEFETETEGSFIIN